MRTLSHSRALFAAVLAFFTPAAALACGGLFCNATQPVNQAAERILFAQDGDTLHMHVRISYSGPPTEFGWLLPAPPDVETFLSSEQLFTVLDQQFGPLFNIQQEFDENCLQNQNRGGGGFVNSPAPQADGGAEGGTGVEVLSREAIGPFDRVILAADSVQKLRDWLDENNFVIPEAVDETLEPYLEMGSVFVAVKLLPGSDSGDILPLHLKFSSKTPAIPIVPTRVAANPDMGVIVHVLAGERAIPKNYAHVKVNEAAIDWMNFGQNYADVVSAAADETAGGKGWVTDYAGTSENVAPQIQPFAQELIDRIAEMTTLGELLNTVGLTDSDLQRLVGGFFEIPEGTPPAQFFQCPQCFGDVDMNQEIDGAAIAAQLVEEVNKPRETLIELFGSNDYLTRLYTTMSPEEMDQDPIFALNPDLEQIDRQRTAIWHMVCDEDGTPLDSLSYVQTPSGIRFQLTEDGQVPDVIVRQDGDTVRGNDVPAARIIEKMFEQGPPQIVEDRTAKLRARYEGEKNSDCTCRAGEGGGNPAAFGLLLIGLVAVRMRRS